MADRPRTYKTEGVVLRRRNVGEADSIFTVFTEDEGKLDGIARGVRKARSHMRGHLEPLTRSRFLLAQGRTFDVFTQAETLTPYRRIRENLERSAEAIYCAELVDRLTADRQPHPEVYRLLLETLDALEGGGALHGSRCFEAQLLALTGYELQLDACASCGGKIHEAEHLLSAAAGGLVCPACRPGAGSGRIVSPRAIKVLRFARSVSPAEFARLRMEPDLARQLQVVLGDVIRSILEREVNASRFVDDVARLGPPPLLTPDDVE